MKHTRVAACLSCRLLRYVRDQRPTVDEFLAWLGSPADAGRYHVLRKAELLLLENGRLLLSPEHLSADGDHFTWANSMYHLDTEMVWVFRCAIGSSPSQDQSTAAPEMGGLPSGAAGGTMEETANDASRNHTV